MAVSNDGTLGWLACEMQANGVSGTSGGQSPLAFGFSWVELLARDATGWKRIGNASNERP